MPTVLQTRGPCREALHPFSAVAVHDGRVVDQLGEPGRTTWRSAAKPFQLAISLACLGDPDIGEETLAVGAASHSGEPRHVALVTALLDRFGLDLHALKCATHPPAHMPSAEAILRANGHFDDRHNNCSGKHAFMAAAARHQGWDPDYRAPDHPLQVRIRAALVQACGEEPELAIDGCGVPTFGFSLEGLARAWQHLAQAVADRRAGRTTPGTFEDRLGRVGAAMAAHPHLTSGTGRFDAAVMAGACEAMVVKVGAMGLFCMAFPQRRAGVAVKVWSGVGEALPTAVEAALAQLVPGAWARPDAWPFDQVTNVAGRVVGDYRLA